MMRCKWLIIVTLYLIGGIIYYFYEFHGPIKNGDKFFVDFYDRNTKKGMPPNMVVLCMTLAVIIVSLLWPLEMLEPLRRKKGKE